MGVNLLKLRSSPVCSSGVAGNVKPVPLFFLLIMTTTNIKNELYDAVSAPLKSTWVSKVDRFARLLLKYRFLRFFVCIDESDLDDLEDDLNIRDDIRVAMTAHTDVVGPDGVKRIVDVISDELRYNLGPKQHPVEPEEVMPPPSVGVVAERAMVVWRTVDRPPITIKRPVQGCQNLLEITDPKVKLVPRFAAAMVIRLRAKFGRLPLDNANRLLIEREYLRVCREGSVRDVDTVMHAQHVYNAYFNEGVLDQVGTARHRAPGWLRRAFGLVPNAPAVVC